MTLKKKIYAASIAAVTLIILSFVYKDAQSELPFFFKFLLGVLSFYTLLLYLFTTKKMHTNWVNFRKNTIPYFIVIITIIISMQMLTKMNVQQNNFWVTDGDIWLMDILGIGLTLIILYLVFSWTFEQWKKIQTLKNEKIKAELALLKNQINPHFFFNSLNCLYSLIKKDQDKAQDYVLKLSDMIRFSVYEGSKAFVPLENEHGYLKNFIDLHVTRYHKTIDIKFNDSIQNLQVKIAPLLFIILLENAFKHGVEKLTDNAFVHLNLVQSEEKITFEIKNNFDLDTEKTQPGIGLENLKERLNLIYPNKHQLSIVKDKAVYYATLEISLT